MLPEGPMQLEKPQPADLMEPYFTGTQPSGGSGRPWPGCPRTTTPGA